MDDLSAYMARASPLCEVDWGSDDEVWLHPGPPPARPPPFPPLDPPASARGQSPPVRRDRRLALFYSALVPVVPLEHSWWRNATRPGYVEIRGARLERRRVVHVGTETAQGVETRPHPIPAAFQHANRIRRCRAETRHVQAQSDFATTAGQLPTGRLLSAQCCDDPRVHSRRPYVTASQRHTVLAVVHATLPKPLTYTNAGLTY